MRINRMALTTPMVPNGQSERPRDPEKSMDDKHRTDELSEWLADVLKSCHRTGMVLPYIVSGISPNGTVTVIRMDGENVEVLAEHYEGGGSQLPMTITVIDQRNEAVRVTITSDRKLVYH
jgi:hypothetical protein